jgi:hypothetical protein
MSVDLEENGTDEETAAAGEVEDVIPNGGYGWVIVAA